MDYPFGIEARFSFHVLWSVVQLLSHVKIFLPKRGFATLYGQCVTHFFQHVEWITYRRCSQFSPCFVVSCAAAFSCLKSLVRQWEVLTDFWLPKHLKQEVLALRSDFTIFQKFPSYVREYKSFGILRFLCFSTSASGDDLEESVFGQYSLCWKPRLLTSLWHQQQVQRRRQAWFQNRMKNSFCLSFMWRRADLLFWVYSVFLKNSSTNCLALSGFVR